MSKSKTAYGKATRRRRTRISPLMWLLGSFVLAGILGGSGGMLYSIPSVRERVDNALYWRVLSARAAVRDLINPPDEFLPAPEPQSTVIAAAPAATIVAPSFEDSAPTAVPASSQPTSTPIPTVTAFVQPTETLAPTETPLPTSVRLTGITHEYQLLNNCGPATLSMTMSFWGFEGDQTDTASWLKPERGDYNVRPDEMVNYINTVQRDWLGAVRRVGGTVELLQTLLAAGYPVIVEESYVLEDQGWMGHYLALVGYDLEQGIFHAQDSFYGPDQRESIAGLDADWKAFNRTFIVIYPREDEATVLDLLGEYADLTRSYEIALETAERETEADPEDAFALHNLGTNYNFFGNFDAAAAAYDEARNIGLPWRMLWYQSGQYRAYYNVGRYSEVIGLANLTLSGMTNANHEESLFWRGWANFVTGYTLGAIDDFQRALYFNHNFTDAQEALDMVTGS